MSDEYDSEILQTILVGEREDINAPQDDNDNNAAMLALLEEGGLSIHDVEFLIEDGLDVNYQNASGRTLLMIMCDYDEEDVPIEAMDILIENEANVNARDRRGNTVLDYVLDAMLGGKITGVGKLDFLLNNKAVSYSDDILFDILRVFNTEADKEVSELISSYQAVLSKVLSSSPIVSYEGREGLVTSYLARIIKDLDDRASTEVVEKMLLPLIEDYRKKRPANVQSLIDATAEQAFSGGSGNIIATELLLKAGANPAALNIVNESGAKPSALELLRKYQKPKPQPKRSASPRTRVMQRVGEIASGTARTTSPMRRAEEAFQAEMGRKPAVQFSPAPPAVAAAIRARSPVPPPGPKDEDYPPCPGIVAKGKRAGEVCGVPGCFGGFCSYHRPDKQ
jgi:hypothetical protein